VNRRTSPGCAWAQASVWQTSSNVAKKRAAVVGGGAVASDEPRVELVCTRDTSCGFVLGEEMSLVVSERR
jgi:hypothetical protein